MRANIIQFFLRRKYILLSLLIITPIGFLCKFYMAPARNWVQNYLVGIFYEIFWSLLGFLFFSSKSSIKRIIFTVFLLTVFIEFTQLIHFSFLEWLRSYFIGRTIIGTSFSWWDFPHYLIGSVIAYILLKFLYDNSPPQFPK